MSGGDYPTKKHEAALRAAALRLCGNPMDANDLVQDVHERALRHLRRLRPGSHMFRWLLTILYRLFVDRYRRHQRELLADAPAEELCEQLAAPEAEPEPAWASITTAQLRAALEELPEEFRSVYELHALQGWSYNDIAERLGIPKATVGTRLIRARRKLREMLLPLATR
jgi:RNA polymerase sigma-70 factor (ECF subfamily)